MYIYYMIGIDNVTEDCYTSKKIKEMFYLQPKRCFHYFKIN